MEKYESNSEGKYKLKNNRTNRQLLIRNKQEQIETNKRQKLLIFIGISILFVTLLILFLSISGMKRSSETKTIKNIVSSSVSKSNTKSEKIDFKYAVPDSQLEGIKDFLGHLPNTASVYELDFVDGKFRSFGNGKLQTESSMKIKNIPTKTIRIFRNNRNEAKADSSGAETVKVNTMITFKPLTPNKEMNDGTGYLFINKDNQISLALPNYAGNVGTRDDMKIMMECAYTNDSTKKYTMYFHSNQSSPQSKDDNLSKKNESPKIDHQVRYLTFNKDNLIGTKFLISPIKYNGQDTNSAMDQNKAPQNTFHDGALEGQFISSKSVTLKHLGSYNPTSTVQYSLTDKKLALGGFEFPLIKTGNEFKVSSIIKKYSDGNNIEWAVISR